MRMEILPHDLESLKRKHPELIVVDKYQKNLEELFLLHNPRFRFDKNYKTDFEKFVSQHCVDKPLNECGKWFYFSWINTVVHFLDENLHQDLRTGRNQLLITKEEQEKFYNTTVAILGMSVGSHVAITLAMTGGAKHIKLADPNTISGDNLNRIRTGFYEVGTNKAVSVAQKIYEINPYANIEIFTDGLIEQNISQILSRIDILIEEMDNPYWKLKIREEAKKRHIPVLMGTDNGDGIITDIERFDLEPERLILHGLIGDLTAENLKAMKPQDLPRVAAKIAGAEFAPPRMLESVAEVGKSLYSWPQLGTAANMCGTILPYLIRKIVLGASNIHSGRYPINPDSMFESDYNSPTRISEREKSLEASAKKLGII